MCDSHSEFQVYKATICPGYTDSRKSKQTLGNVRHCVIATGGRGRNERTVCQSVVHLFVGYCPSTDQTETAGNTTKPEESAFTSVHSSFSHNSQQITKLGPMVFIFTALVKNICFFQIQIIFCLNLYRIICSMKIFLQNNQDLIESIKFFFSHC